MESFDRSVDIDKPNPDKNKKRFTPTPASIDKGYKKCVSLAKKKPMCERTITKIAKPLSSSVTEFGKKVLSSLLRAKIVNKINSTTAKI